MYIYVYTYTYVYLYIRIYIYVYTSIRTTRAWPSSAVEKLFPQGRKKRKKKKKKLSCVSHLGFNGGHNTTANRNQVEHAPTVAAPQKKRKKKKRNCAIRSNTRHPSPRQDRVCVRAHTHARAHARAFGGAFMYMYVFIERERERDRERCACVHVRACEFVGALMYINIVDVWMYT